MTAERKPFARIVRENGVRRMYVGPQYIGDAHEHPDSGVVALGIINNAVDQRDAQLLGSVVGLIRRHETHGPIFTAVENLCADVMKLHPSGDAYVLASDLEAERAKTRGHWMPLLDAMLEKGGEGAADVARALAGKLGIELKVPVNGSATMRAPHPEYLANIDGVGTYPEDVSMLQLKLPALRTLDAVGVEALYTQFSQEEYSAGWMIMAPHLIERFSRWLTEGWGLICASHGIFGRLERGDKCGPCDDRLRNYDATTWTRP